MLNKKIESKFQRFAEVLPTNARTAIILKEREEIRAAKEAQEKQVSTQANCCWWWWLSHDFHSTWLAVTLFLSHHLTNSLTLPMITLSIYFPSPTIAQRPAVERGARSQEEGELGEEGEGVA